MGLSINTLQTINMRYIVGNNTPAARCGNLMLMKRYGTLKIDCCIPVLADSNIL